MWKKITSAVFISFLIVSIVACTATQASTLPTMRSAPAATDLSAVQTMMRTITVVGKGQVSLDPDLAIIHVGAEARAETVAEAKADVEAVMAEIITALQKMDIADKDVQTSHYSIHYEREQVPIMPSQPVSDSGEGYYVSNMLEVTIRDVETAGDVLDGVVQAGANQVHGVMYTVADESEWQSQARALAIADARSHAEELADLAGVELGEVLSVSEIIGNYPVPMMISEGGGGGIMAGELDFATQLQVTFAIR